MKALVKSHPKRGLWIDDVPEPEVGINDVKIRVLATGRDMLYGIAVTDPLSIASAALLLTSAGLLAGYLPARRAARVDPLTALRYE